MVHRSPRNRQQIDHWLLELTGDFLKSQIDGVGLLMVDLRLSITRNSPFNYHDEIEPPKVSSVYFFVMIHFDITMHKKNEQSLSVSDDILMLSKQLIMRGEQSS